MTPKKARVLAAITTLALIVGIIPIAQSWAAEGDAPVRSHTWELAKVDDLTGTTFAAIKVGQQMQIKHRIKVSVVVQTDEGWVEGQDDEVDRCVTLSDSRAGDIGDVCAGATPVTFEYPVPIGPYDACGRYEHESVTSLVTDDTGTQATLRWITNVLVMCAHE